MTINFLFWNLQKKPLERFITNLAHEHKVDVLMLAECSIHPSILLTSLNHIDKAQYHYSSQIGCEKIEVFTRFPRRFIKIVREDSRFTIRHLLIPTKTNILLAIAHLPSKMYFSDSSQVMMSTKLANEIELAEKQVGHFRTVLVGDLNMNPFEDGVVSAIGLHATMSRKIAERKSRTVQSKEYIFFYNPMWNFLGDETRSKTPGTYYFNQAEYRNFYWNTFDQVLIRPDLLPLFHIEDLQILDSDGKISFLSKDGLPNPNTVSDHLPIIFKLNL